jgi:uncharacterized membrane protein
MARRRSPSELATFLLTRGLWLIVLEVLVISTATSFALTGVEGFGGRIYIHLQVIWVIGASMMILAGAQFLGRHACLAIGAAIVLGHNLLDRIWPAAMTSASTAPLVGGIAFAAVLRRRSVRDLLQLLVAALARCHVPRLRLCRSFRAAGEERDDCYCASGVSLVIAFVLLRALNVYGDPHLWEVHPSRTAATIMSFLATTKYPPSLLYLLMTLGPGAILCALPIAGAGRSRMHW